MLYYNTLVLFSIRAVSCVKVFKGGLLENKVKILLVLVILIFDEPLLSGHLPLPREWPLNPLSPKSDYHQISPLISMPCKTEWSRELWT